MALGKLRKRRQFVAPKLQITSMMDMFTIILIFLLFSFSNRPESIQFNKDLKLPESEAKMDYKDNIKLILSRSTLQLENKVVAEIKEGKIIGLNPRKLKQSNLYRELKAYRKQADASNTDKESKEAILFLCDKRLPFKTINNIVKTAAMAGFPNFQFGVLKK
ncbi:MAG: ExbD/TolR family protein [bacterium]